MNERRAIKALLRPYTRKFVQMATWSKEELQRIATADDLHVAPFRNDDKTYGTPTWTWSVVVDDALYVRAYSGVKSRWYQAALKQKAGRIIAGGMTKEVTFEPADDKLKDSIDQAYRAKYRKSAYLNPMIGADPSAATIQIMPREIVVHTKGSGIKET